MDAYIGVPELRRYTEYSSTNTCFLFLFNINQFFNVYHFVIISTIFKILMKFLGYQ